jgi:outer membrane immunogenic protein
VGLQSRRRRRAWLVHEHEFEAGLNIVAAGATRYLILPNLMAYGTVGGAWGKIDYAASNFAPGAVPYGTGVAFSNTQGGWVAGGGLEWMIINNWLLRGEFLYYSLNNSPSVVVTPVTHSALPSGYLWSNTNVSVVRAALSYKF